MFSCAGDKHHLSDKLFKADFKTIFTSETTCFKQFLHDMAQDGGNESERHFRPHLHADVSRVKGSTSS